jgi:cytidyltransferase-like protein
VRFRLHLSPDSVIIMIDVNDKFNKFYSCLNSFVKKLQKEKIECWLDFTSLLHAFRNQDSNYRDRKVIFGFHGYNLNDLLKFNGRILSDNTVPFIVWDKKFNCTKVYLNGKGPDDYYAVFYHCEKKGSDLIYQSKSTGAKFRFKCYYVDEPEAIAFNGFSFPCPRYLHKFVNLRYGDNWKTVDPNSSLDGNLGKIENYITGYIEGTFDLFHVNHLDILKRGKHLYDKLIVGICSDEGVAGYKCRPIMPQEHRMRIVSAIRYVDEVILRTPPLDTTLDLMERYNIDYVYAGRRPNKWLQRWYAEPMEASRLHVVRESNGIHTKTLLDKIVRQYSGNVPG